MTAQAGEGAVVIVAAADPVPAGDTLLYALFVAAARLYGTQAIEDIAAGPRSTAILILSGDSHAETSTSLLEEAVRVALRDRGHPAASVDISRLVGAESASASRESAERWVAQFGAEISISSQRHAYRGAVSDLLKRRNLHTGFQPIVSLRAEEVFGYEAISRGPASHPLETPDQLLEAAAHAGYGREMNSTLAWLARVRARQRIADDSALLFINLDADNFHPSASHIFDWEGDRLWPLNRTVVELTERAPVLDLGPFERLRDYARDLGVRFALDDTGAGYAGLSTLATLRPDFIKLDATLTRGCDSSPTQRAAIAALGCVAEQSGAELIAEGVETVSELAAVQSLGVDLVQGFLLGSPDEMPAALTGVAWLHADRSSEPQQQAIAAG